MKTKSILSRKRKYVQLAFNNTIEDAVSIVRRLPGDDRILLEAGTPLIKKYGMNAVTTLYYEYSAIVGQSGIRPYIVADMKTMDRGSREVAMCAEAGASAVIALGTAPVETINSFIEQCETAGIDSMLDMMNVDFPNAILHKLKKRPTAVILHRGVDEEEFNKEKQIPYHEIQRIKGSYDLPISIAGGDTVREIQRSLFNGADIVVIWKALYDNSANTFDVIREILRQLK